MDVYYTGSEFIVSSVPEIPITDLSVLRGFGVFDFLRTYNRHPFHLKDHLARLANSARLLEIPLPMATTDIEEIVHDAIRRSDHAECNIRLVLTGGESSDGITPAGKPRQLIMVTAVTSLPPESYTDGVKVITSYQDRFLPGAKTIHYIPAILCQKEAKSRGAIESIYLDRNGYLLEGTTSNFFIVRNNQVITQPCDRVLPGVTRKVVLSLLKNQVELVERPIHRDELRLIDESFLSSSVREVTPIVQVDSISIGQGEPGPVSQRVMTLFREYTQNYSGDQDQ